MHGTRPICPKCGVQMGVARIELIGQPDSDLRTFKCPLCSGELTETVRHNTAIRRAKFNRQRHLRTAPLRSSNRRSSTPECWLFPSGLRGVRNQPRACP
jgi:hypothetical protein